MTSRESIPSGYFASRVLETERLLLRRIEDTAADAANLMGIFSDPEAMRFYPSTKNAEEARGWIRWNLDNYERHGFGLWMAHQKNTGAFAGQCGLVVQEVEGQQEVEIGYLFLRSLWNQGLATEAASACRDFGFNRLGLTRLISLIDPGNIASRRVAEKVGMTMERQIAKWGKDVCVYQVQQGRLTTDHEK